MAELKKNFLRVISPFVLASFFSKKINHSLWFDERGSFEAVFVASA